MIKKLVFVSTLAITVTLFAATCFAKDGDYISNEDYSNQLKNEISIGLIEKESLPDNKDLIVLPNREVVKEKVQEVLSEIPDSDKSEEDIDKIVDDIFKTVEDYNENDLSSQAFEFWDYGYAQSVRKLGSFKDWEAGHWVGEDNWESSVPLPIEETSEEIARTMLGCKAEAEVRIKIGASGEKEETQKLTVKRGLLIPANTMWFKRPVIKFTGTQYGYEWVDVYFNPITWTERKEVSKKTTIDYKLDEKYNQYWSETRTQKGEKKPSKPVEP